MVTTLDLEEIPVPEYDTTEPQQEPGPVCGTESCVELFNSKELRAVKTENKRLLERITDLQRSLGVCKRVAAGLHKEPSVLAQPVLHPVRRRVAEADSRKTTTRYLLYGYLAAYWACMSGHRPSVFTNMKEDEVVASEKKLTDQGVLIRVADHKTTVRFGEANLAVTRAEFDWIRRLLAIKRTMRSRNRSVLFTLGKHPFKNVNRYLQMAWDEMGLKGEINFTLIRTALADGVNMLYRDLEGESISQFGHYLSRRRSLTGRCSLFDDGAVCPACPKTNGTTIVTMDANFGLVRKQSAGTSVAEPLHGNSMFVNDADVEEYHHILIAPNQLRPAYPMYIISELVKRYQSKNIHLHFIYNIACVLSSHMHKNGEGVPQGISLVVPAFHVYGHKLQC
ncbi:uncharacterized protein LOC115775772 isoform X2 [Archocentrus centrarchus]|uniref:uncharacterized protein LOC115775772 isoform X2 n=1 Tax=Archocentrus centrarchus TaxID=63155 RepID=UPI0011E9C9CD|nr:uncharacterized protein LOC115775772 isoform X2 [Archocentrus centrarchus]